MIMSVGLLATVLPSPAQEKEDSPQVIQVVYEVFSLDRAEAAASQRSPVPDTKLYGKMLDGLKQGKVKQEKLQAIRTVAARGAHTKHISEFIYASEYDPPELPNQVGTGTAPWNPRFMIDGPSKKKNIDDLEIGPGWSEGESPATPANGSAFKTRELGDLLEVEAVILNSKTKILQVDLSANHVELDGVTTWGQSLAESKMPIFATRSVGTQLEVKAGIPTLLATVSPPVGEGDERVWFAFMTVSLIDID